MNIYQRGTGIALVQRFWNLDPITGEPVLTNPTAVVFTIKDSEGQDQVFTFGVDGNVTNPSVGLFLCRIPPQIPVGIYHYVCVGTGAVEAQSEDDFEIVESAVLAPEQPNTPVMGPYSPWISGQDVAQCTRLDYGQQPWLFDTVAYEAGSALYEISGRRFPGIQTRAVRPTQNNCGCWLNGPISYGFGPLWWTGAPWGSGGGWGWYNETGDRFGCSPMSVVRLAGYPVREILEVNIGGVILPEFDPDTNARNWRLDRWRDLVRMNTPGDPAQPRFWPGCQDMSLDVGQPGTFGVTHRWGTDVPQLGREAAKEIANQLFLACGGQECVLPTGVTRATREGITVDRGLLANWADPTKPTGLVNLDLFLQAYNNGQRSGRRSMIYSPDLQQFARRVGTS